MINVVTPGFVQAHSLDIDPLSDLADGTLSSNGFREVFSWPLGYIIIRVQEEGVQGYNEDQVALVVPDSTIFGSQVSFTLGTPTINWIINMIKESEINELLASLNRLKMAQLLACQQAELLLKGEAAMHQAVDLTDLKEAVNMTKREEVDAFSSKIIHSWMKTLLLRNNMHVMTQVLKGGGGPHMPHGLSVVNTYTKLISRSKYITVVVKNLTTILITIAEGIKVTHVVPMLCPLWN